MNVTKISQYLASTGASRLANKARGLTLSITAMAVKAAVTAYRCPRDWAHWMLSQKAMRKVM